MKNFAMMLGALIVAGALVGSAQAGDALFYYGHAGLNEGHTQFAGVIAADGGTLDFDNSATLPTLVGSTWNLVVISVPGLGNPSDVFSNAEKTDISTWLAQTLSHRLVLIGEWDGFYGAGQAVLIDLVNAVGGGTGISFIPGAYDCDCFSYNCAGALGADPLVAGLDHVCRACTAIWNPGAGGSVAFTVESPDNPWIVSNGTVSPCIVCIGDSNTLSDGCGHLGDADTAEFARRLHAITCAGTPVPVQERTWGGIKTLYR